MCLLFEQLKLTTMKIPKLILLILALFSFVLARAERKTQSRQDASHVVVGEVTEVFKSEGKTHIFYVVRIRVEMLEKGSGSAKGQHFYAECFERKPHKGTGVAAPGISGHSAVPKVGDRVRVFVNEKESIYEGVYPNWYDALPKVDKK
jgi:hypothetical protein